jgi:hypothetical protein
MAEFHPTPTSPRFKNLAEQRFGRLVVLGYAGSRHRIHRWLCLCDCGNQKVVRADCLTSEQTRSCGCLSMERRTTHGMSKTLEHGIWTAMIGRCHNPNNADFATYGALGVTVCERWRESFQAFYDDMGPRPSRKHSLDRHPDHCGNYEPDNCRWATQKQQCRNKRNNHLLTYNGETLCAIEWAEKLGWDKAVIFNRLRYGWSVERILSTPLRAIRKGPVPPVKTLD